MIFCGQCSTHRLQLRHLFKNLSEDTAPGGRIISEIFSAILFLNSILALSAAPKISAAEEASIRLRLFKLNLGGSFFLYHIEHLV